LKKLLYGILLAGIMGGTAFAQKIEPKSKLILNIDYSRFRYSNTESCLEISYSVYPSLITLKRDSAGYKGALIIETIARNKLTDSIFIDQLASLPVALEDTSFDLLHKALVAKLVYSLPFGTYDLEVKAKDYINPARKDSGKLTFEMISYSDKPAVSDVDMCSNITPSVQKNSPFYKNSYEAVPNPSLFYGSSEVPVVFSYVELYNLTPRTTYVIKVQVSDAKGQVQKERSRLRQFGHDNTVDVTTLPVTGIVSGKYKFIFILADTSNKIITQTEKPIYIYNPQVQRNAAALYSAKSAEMAGMTSEELSDEFRRAQYVASSEDIRTFGKLSTTEAKREFLAKFWIDVEGGLKGRTDITRAVYLDRVLIANQRYHSLIKEGWLTDRGRVFISYAEPDEIERFPNSEGNKPYEVWHYYQIENGVEFVFIDRQGFGDYTLMHSTKRGEIQDNSWEQYLH
jgi:GWxTD domain-containing protein